MVLRGARLWQLQGPLCHHEHLCLPKEPPRVLTFQVTQWHIPRSPWSLSVLLLSYCPQSLHGVFGRLFISRACSVLGAVVTLDHPSRKKEMLWGHSPRLGCCPGQHCSPPLRSLYSPLLGPLCSTWLPAGLLGRELPSLCLSLFFLLFPPFFPLPFCLFLFLFAFFCSTFFFFSFLSSPIFGCSF